MQILKRKKEKKGRTEFNDLRQDLPAAEQEHDLPKSKGKRKKSKREQGTAKKEKAPKSQRKKESRKRAGSKKPLLSIDMGCNQIKAVTGQFKNGRVHVKSVYSQSMPISAYGDGKIKNQGDVIGSISNLIKENKINIKQTVCTVESSNIIQREILVPDVADSEMLGLLSYEMGQYLPIDITSYAIQYKRIEGISTESGPRVKVRVCAMPRAMAEEYLAILEDMGQEAFALDVNPNALGKLFQLENSYNMNNGIQNIVAIDMGHSRFDISFFKSGEYIFNRIADIGGGMVDDVILRNIDTTVLEAERNKQTNLAQISALQMYMQYGEKIKNMDSIEDPKDLIPVQTVAVFDHWMKTISGIMEYYLTRDSSNNIDLIYLFGGSAEIKDIDQLFERRFNITTRKLENLSCLDLDPSIHVSQIPKYINAIGALIRL